MNNFKFIISVCSTMACLNCFGQKNEVEWRNYHPLDIKAPDFITFLRHHIAQIENQ